MFSATSSAFAGDIDLPASGDLWDNFSSQNINDGQEAKSVSDEDFDKAIEAVKEKQNNKFSFFKRKKKNKNIPKGEEFSQSSETQFIEEHVEKESLPVVTIPIEIPIDDTVLPIGHYQIKGEKDDDGNVVLNFYQAHYLMAKFPAVETLEDFGEDALTFAKWFPEGEDKIKVIFGSLDLNAYAIIKIK